MNKKYQQENSRSNLRNILKAAENLENKHSFIFDETRHVTHFFKQREDISTHSYSEYFHDVMKCISNGDVENLKSLLLKSDPELEVGLMSKDPLRQAKYSFVVMVTLISRLAIENGLDSETSYTMSDIYSQKMDGCSTCYEVAEVYVRMVYDYTHRIADVLHKKDYSFITRRASEYIIGHLHYPIKLKEIADYAGVSENYLSAYFKSDTGKTISQSILELRLAESKDLLRYTRKSCKEISFSLCFSSPSYFAQQFRSFYGITPKEYRKQYGD